jgi:hypothetical protein
LLGGRVKEEHKADVHARCMWDVHQRRLLERGALYAAVEQEYIDLALAIQVNVQYWEAEAAETQPKVRTWRRLLFKPIRGLLRPLCRCSF